MEREREKMTKAMTQTTHDNDAKSSSSAIQKLTNKLKHPSTVFKSNQ